MINLLFSCSGVLVKMPWKMLDYFLAVGILTFSFPGFGSAAQLFIWSPPVAITTADVTLNQPGTLVGAAVFGGIAKIVILTNGESFDFTTNGSVASVPLGSTPYTGTFTNSSTGNANFDAVLNQGTYINLSSRLITLTNLAVGQLYAVQLFAVDNRNTTTVNRIANYQDPNNGSDVSATFKMGDNVYVVGTFTATNATMGLLENMPSYDSATINGLALWRLGPPSPPTLSAVVTNTQVALRWNAQAGVTGYYLKRSTTSGSSYVTIAANVVVTNYLDTNVTVGVTYYYVASATNTYGESANSFEVSAVIGGGVPATGLVALAGPGLNQITLMWNPNTTNTGYNVKRSTTSGSGYATIAANLPGTNYVDTNIATGITYYYVVSGTNAFGESANSAETSLKAPLYFWQLPVAITTADAALNQPGTLVGAAAFGGIEELITLSNGANVDFKADGSVASIPYGNGTFGGVFSGYTGNANFNALLNQANWVNYGNNRAITLTNLVVGQAYAVQLFALDDRHDGGIAEATLQSCFQNPNDGTDVSANFAMGNNVYVVGTFTATSLTMMVQQNFFNNQQPGINALVIWRLGPPKPPILTAVSTNLQVALQWDNQSSVTGYYLSRSTTSGGGYMTIASNLTVTGYVDANVTPGIPYYYVVSANSAFGGSGNSAEVSALAGAAETPTGLTAAAGPGANEVTLNWSSPSYANTGYNVKRSSTSGSGYVIIAANVPATTFVDPNVTAGVTYYYVVSGINAAGESRNSAEISAYVQSSTHIWWSAPVSITTANATLNQPGTLVGAAVFGGAEEIVTLSNGTNIDFKADGSVASIPYANGPYTGTFTGNTSNANFNAVLNQANWPNAATRLITLNNLVVGQAYAVQLFAMDDRSWTVARTANYQNPNDGTDVSATFAMGDNVYVVGEFTATSPTVLVQQNLQNTDGAALNALAVWRLGPPSPPSPSAAMGFQGVTLSWNATATATGYNVKRSSTSGSGYITIAANVTGTSFLDTNVTVGITYYYVLSSLNASGEGTNSSQTSVLYNPLQISVPPGIANFTAGPASIVAGGSTVLSWSVTNQGGLMLSPGPGPWTPNLLPPEATVMSPNVTQVTVQPAQTVTYVLSATNGFGMTTQAVTVTVAAPPGRQMLPTIFQFGASPLAIGSGGQSMLTWLVYGATNLSIYPNVGNIMNQSAMVNGDFSGSITVSPASTVTYVLAASNSNGTATATATVTMGAQTVTYEDLQGADLGINASLNGALPFPPDTSDPTNPVGNSLINKNISQVPADPMSLAYIAHLARGASHTNLWVSQAMSYAVVANSQPLVSMDYGSYTQYNFGYSAPSPWPIPPDTLVQQETIYTNNPAVPIFSIFSADRHIFVINRDANLDCEAYQVNPPVAGSTNEGWIYTVGSYTNVYGGGGVQSNIFGGGVIYNLATSMDTQYVITNNYKCNSGGAYYFPFLVRYDEASSGAIRHCLVMSLGTGRQGMVLLPCRTLRNFTPWAADNALLLPNGARVRLKKSFVIPANLSTETRAILQCLKDYGAMTIDSDQEYRSNPGQDIYGWSMMATGDTRWPAALSTELAAAVNPSQDMEVVEMSPALMWTAPGSSVDQSQIWAANVNQNWDTNTANWSGSIWNNTNDAIFSSTGIGTINLGTGVIANSLTFSNAGYTVANGTLTLIGVSSITANANATISSAIAGNEGLVTSGTGTLTLAGANTYTGPTMITAGTLRPAQNATPGDFFISGGAALDITTIGNLTIGSLAGSGTVSLGNNTLTTGGDNNSTVYSGLISGSGTVIKAGTGIWSLSGSNTCTGVMTVNGGALQAGSSFAFGGNSAVTLATSATLDLNTFSIALGSLAGSGMVTLGSGNLTTGGNNGSTTFGGVMSGNGSIIKTGSGTWTLSGVNSYTGGTTINGGKLALSGGGSIANTPSISVAGGAIFDVSGLSAMTLGASQILNNSASTAAIAGNLNTGLGQVYLNFAVGTPSFLITNGILTLSTNTVLNINNTGAGLAAGSYKLISKAISGNVGVVAGAVPATVTVGGSGAPGGAILQIVGGELYLNVGGTSITGVSLSLSNAPFRTIAANGISSYNYILQRKTNLASMAWFNIVTNLATTSGPVILQDTFKDLNSNAPPAAFYRLQRQP